MEAWPRAFVGWTMLVLSGLALAMSVGGMWVAAFGGNSTNDPIRNYWIALVGSAIGLTLVWSTRGPVWLAFVTGIAFFGLAGACALWLLPMAIGYMLLLTPLSLGILLSLAHSDLSKLTRA